MGCDVLVQVIMPRRTVRVSDSNYAGSVTICSHQATLTSGQVPVKRLVHQFKTNAGTRAEDARQKRALGTPKPLHTIDFVVVQEYLFRH
jgi:hypothetical protein